MYKILHFSSSSSSTNTQPSGGLYVLVPSSLSSNAPSNARGVLVFITSHIPGQQDCTCKLHTPLGILDYIGYAAATLSACALIYKLYIFITLKRNGKLRKDLGFVKGFLAVIAYGGKGDHIIVSNDNNTMEENLLGEEDRVGDDDDMLEMPTVRESFSEILDTAGLSKYKTKFAKHGIQSTSHLDDILEEDLEELGLSGFQRRQFNKAATNVKKKKEMQQNDGNNSTDNGVIVANDTNNKEEGSK